MSNIEQEELFDDWNGLKQELHFEKKTYPHYREREIWWIALGQNIGSEVYGKGDDHLRPILVLKKFGKSFLGIPLTSQSKDMNPHFFISQTEEEKILGQCLRKFDFLMLKDYFISRILEIKFLNLCLMN